jgi:hypothetical protein
MELFKTGGMTKQQRRALLTEAHLCKKIDKGKYEIQTTGTVPAVPDHGDSPRGSSMLKEEARSCGQAIKLGAPFYNILPTGIITWWRVPLWYQ